MGSLTRDGTRSAIDDGTRDIMTRRRYIAYGAALLYGLSFLLPWFSISPNRMALASPVSLYSLGPSVAAVIVLTAAILITQIATARRWIQATAVFSAALLSVGIPVLLVQLVYTSQHQVLNTTGRIGLSAGWYVFIAAGLLQVIPRSRPRWSLAGAAGVFTLSLLLIYFGGSLERLGLVREAVTQQRRLPGEFLQHVRITFISVSISTAAGIPAAIAAYRSLRARRFLFSLFNVLQTIPAIALFGLMMVPLAMLGNTFPLLREVGFRGIGNTPAIIALAVYGLYPVMRNSFTALSRLDGGIVDAARGMGMNPLQEWRLVRIPLATPIILNGVRIAAVQTTGNAVLAKLIGGNGLGVFVFEGLGQASADLVLLGMGLTILLTLSIDILLQAAITAVTPKSLQKQYGGKDPQFDGVSA
jgi:osmoprotectant transport system permease protein